jgi:hypothetical protein
MQIVELGRLPGFRVGAAGALLVTVFRETANAERLTLLEELQGRFVKDHPRMFALNVIVGERMQAPDANLRERAAALQKRFDSSTAAAVTVLAVKGLGAVLARGFLAGLALVSSGSKPTQVFKTTAEALAWLQGLPDFPPELLVVKPDEVAQFVADVR